MIHSVTKCVGICVPAIHSETAQWLSNAHGWPLCQQRMLSGFQQASAQQPMQNKPQGVCPCWCHKGTRDDHSHPRQHTTAQPDTNTLSSHWPHMSYPCCPFASSAPSALSAAPVQGHHVHLQPFRDVGQHPATTCSLNRSSMPAHVCM